MRLILVLFISLCLTTPVWAGDAKKHNGSHPSGPGMATDASGGPVVDPTKNVMDLVEATNKRQDDLRMQEEKYIDAELRHVREQAELRAQYDKLLREIDTARQEKVREVDVLGARTEAERAQAAIKALAETSSTTAETLRKTVETTASSQASQLDMKFAESNKRIAALENSFSEGRGKQTVSDPQLIELASDLKAMRALQTQGAGKSEGMGAMWGYVAGAIGLVISILGAFGIMLGIRNRAPVQEKAPTQERSTIP